ncbi:MAG: hypothetical protein ACXITV_03805 [Luteibaculaceae bacterium]
MLSKKASYPTSKRFFIAYLFVVLLTLVVYAGKYGFYFMPLMAQFYLADFLFLPFTLPAIRFAIEQIFSKFKIAFVYTIWHILVAVAMASWYFEFYLPSVNTRYVFDPMDIVAYFLGGILVLIFLNPTKRINFRSVFYKR